MLTASVCVVARNEEKYLPALLQDLKNQDFPHGKTEILLIDSNSVDTTREIMETFQRENRDYMRIEVLENPKGTQASGWNVAIAAAKNDVLFRIDAHAKIPSDFVPKNMKNIEAGESISGGKRPCLIEQNTPWAKTLLQAENSMFGSSVNSCRRDGERRYVKTMFHAAYRREIFQKVGVFNEQLGRTEDNELHYRMRKAGYRFCFDPDIVSYQYSRSSLKKMLTQKFSNGYWIGLTLGVCPGCLSVFYFVPLCFVLGIAFTSACAALGFPLLCYLMWGAYAAFAVGNTVLSARDEGANCFTAVMPFLFLLLHLSYGIGTLWGLVKMPFWKRTYIPLTQNKPGKSIQE